MRVVPCRRDEGAGLALLRESGVGEVVRVRMPCSAAWHEEQGGYLRSLCSEDCGLNAGKCCARTAYSAAFFAGAPGPRKCAAQSGFPTRAFRRTDVGASPPIYGRGAYWGKVWQRSTRTKLTNGVCVLLPAFGGTTGARFRRLLVVGVEASWLPRTGVAIAPYLTPACRLTHGSLEAIGWFLS